MLFQDLIQETYLSFVSNKARSGLTIPGIVIGIASVLAMIAIGQGSQDTIQSNIQSLGSNLILVSPGRSRGAGTQVSEGRGSAQTLTMADAESLKDISLTKEVAPELSSRYQVTAKGTNTNTSIVGVTTSYPEVRSIEVETGSFITDQNIKSLSKVAIIGPTVRDDLFGVDSTPIGQTIRINGIIFKVIGITKAKGGTGFGSQDDMIFIPISTAQQFLAGSSRVSTISVQAINANSMEELQTEITSLLLQRHNISDSSLADFSVMNQSDIVATASSVTKTFTMLLGSVAAISLVVGGIGIMNMMLTTVTECTREIGLRKAIGAKSKDINLQFLTEASVLTFVGGVIGVIVG